MMWRLGYCLLLSLVLGGASSQKKASSAIPDRREFPVNKSADPCNNFYDYACSEVISSFRLRDDRSAHTFSFNDSHERLLEAKKKYLASLATSKNKSKRAGELNDVYQACMNPEAGKKEEKAQVSSLLQELKAVKDREGFLDYMAKHYVSGGFTTFDYDVLNNFDNPLQYDLYVVADMQTLPERSYYDKAEVMADFTKVVESLFKSVGFADAAKRAKDVAAFEKEFAQSFPLPEEFDEIVNSRSQISKTDLLKKFPNFKMQDFLSKVPDNALIRDLTPKNFAWLNEAFGSYSLDTLKDVYTWRALSSLLDDGYPDFFKTYFDFKHKHLGGPEKRPVREERCTMMVMHRFEKEIDAELVDKIFPSFPSADFVKLAEKVRAAIIEGLEVNGWLSPESREKAIKKMQVARLQLVKPQNEAEWNFNPPADYKADKPVTNMQTLKVNLLNKVFADLRSPRDPNEWDMGPLTINAYYQPALNKFVMPIGILQYPFYDPKAPLAVNLGAVGVVIGHELGHGVDDMGSRYDETGRLKAWMGERDLKEFEQRGKQLVEQFNAIGHNGVLTLGENIGDLVGLSFAYQAAFPGNKGSIKDKQAFFLQYARTWCQVRRPKFHEMLLKVDPHASGDARVNEQVKHQPGFVEAFQCKEGDKLYLSASKRVVIW